MKREGCMLKLKAGMLSSIEEAICKKEKEIQETLVRFGALNASVWTVEGYVYLYAEFEDENEKGLNDILNEYACSLACVSEWIEKPENMRRMYHDIGIVREDKHLIRRRVFATHLKPDCAEEYYNRHKALIKISACNAYGENACHNDNETEQSAEIGAFTAEQRLDKAVNNVFDEKGVAYVGNA